MFMSTHTGKHMDALSHFVPGLASIYKMPAGRIACSAMLVRVPRKANQRVQQQDFEDIKIRQCDAVVIATGWEKRAAKSNYMSDNPGFSGSAAKYIAKKKINAVAIDGPRI